MDTTTDAPVTSRVPTWLRLVGPITAVVLMSRIDLYEVGLSLKDAHWTPVVVSLALVAPLFFIKAWRWRLLLRACGRPIPLGHAFWLYMVSSGAGSLTPGAVGDFWKGLSPLVGRRSIGLWTSAIDRVYDLAIVIVMGVAISIAWLHGAEYQAFGSALAFVAVAGLWLMRGRVIHLAASLLPKFPQAAGSLHTTAPAAAGATVVATLVALVRFHLLVIALALPLRWPQSFVAFVLTSGVTALPLSVAGVGTRDLALLGYLRACGVSSADAIALSSLCLLLFVWNGVVGALLWLFQPSVTAGPAA